jgi:hypothetical protein
MASTKVPVAPTPVAEVPAAPVFTFADTEAPKSNGAGRPVSAEVKALIDALGPLPINATDSDTGWKSFDAPDVSAFVTALRNAGNSLGCSFKIRHNVTVTKDDTLNPGVVKFLKIARVTRERKPKAEAEAQA